MAASVPVPGSRRRSILHIGTHRTGTTSVQRFLRDHLGAPVFPVGSILDDVHEEVAFVAMRPERYTVTVIDPAERGPSGRAAAAEWVRRVVESDVDRLVLSSETLSLLRHPDEIDRVADLLAGREWEVLLVVRDTAEYLASYEVAVRLVGAVPGDDPDQPTYLGPDTWLVDHAARVQAWERWSPVTVVDYDEVVAREGSVIPTVARLVGIEPAEYWLNSRREIFRELWSRPRRQDP